MVICVIIVWGIAILLPLIFLLYMKFTAADPPTTTNKTLKNREGYVIKEIKPENISGKVKLINGSKIWSATADREIEIGTRVKITESRGVHVVVEKIE